MSVCGFRPFPGSGAYGHWTCRRRRFHLGRHRSINYTIARIPRVWRVRRLWRDYRRDKATRQRFASHGVNKPGLGYRRTLYPTKYQPEPTR